MTFEAMWRALLPIGRVAGSGGYFRQPYAAAELEMRAWFVEAAEQRGLRVESDGFGNLTAWWGPDHGRGGAVVTGSHLDSVLDGGAFDGPLGVVSALAAVDVLRDRGFVASRPLGIGVFAEEEGSRFGVACLGSRLATGILDWSRARELRDRDGVFLPDAMEAAGVIPEPPTVGTDEIGDGLRSRIGTFVELHVEQGRHLVDLGRAVGVASDIWPHGRYRLTFEGEANHAGTTRMDDRRDPMLTFAMTALAANKQARLADARATIGRVETTPNSTNSVPSRVTAWLDARAASGRALEALVGEIARLAGERAGRDGTRVEVTRESVSDAVAFDERLAARLSAGHEGGDWPLLPTQAGHDAGILAAAGIPAAMLFVRNPTGVSHSPREEASVADCLVGVQALADTLERLAGPG